ncbi:MAG: 3-dehydroquinate synthase [Verrucomicrobiota bacterium]
MTRMEQLITVQWRHQVCFTRQVFAPGNALLRDVLLELFSGETGKTLVCLDAALAAARPTLTAEIEVYFTAVPGIQLVCPPVTLPGGEAIKVESDHLATLHALVDRHHLDRHSCILCLGGGALLDLVGYAAATAHRGVRLVRLPTTTLSQADSGVGVKNGINAFGKKNFLGTFAPPAAVINDFDFLETLPERDKRAGYSEAVKVACIRDRAFFEALEQRAAELRRCEPSAMAWLVERCAALHLQHIAGSGDPFEMGSARPLDFGHWAAHQLEQLSQYRLRHGEAVAIGIALDTLYASHISLLERGAAERVLALLRALGFALFAEELQQTDAQGRHRILNGLEEFREHLGGRLTITLLAGIGQGIEVHTMDTGIVLRAIQELASYASPTA